MTVYNLLEELKEVISEGTKNNIGFITESETLRIPKVELGYLPMKGKSSNKELDDFPYILIRYKEGEDEDDEGEASIQLILGAFRDNETGWKDILNMIELIRKIITTKDIFKNGVLQYPIKYKIPDEQAIPYFVGTVDLKFTIAKYSTEGACQP